MKIGIIEPVGGHGGMNYYDYGLALGLEANNVEPTLYTCDRTELEFTDRIETYRTYKNIWGDRNKLVRLFNYLRSSWKTFHHAKKRGIKTLHFHFFDVRILEVYDLLLSYLMGFKRVVTIHDIETFEAGKRRLFSLNSVGSYINAYIVHNETSKQALLSTFKIDASKIHVIPHGNFEAFINPSAPVIQIQEVTPDDFAVLFFGQIKNVKGLDILLHSIPKCKDQIPNLKLVIAGKCWQSDFDQYQKIIDDLGIGEQVALRVEYIPDDEVSGYYERADLVVLPYKRIYQSGVLLMTMNYGKPVLVSDLDAMKEIITDGDNGYIFKTGSAEDLADKILYIYHHSEEAKLAATKGLEEIREKYSWTKIGDQTKNVYSSL